LLPLKWQYIKWCQELNHNLSLLGSGLLVGTGVGVGAGVGAGVGHGVHVPVGALGYQAWEVYSSFSQLLSHTWFVGPHVRSATGMEP